MSGRLIIQVRSDAPRIYRRLARYINQPIQSLALQLYYIHRRIRGDDILQLSVRRIAANRESSYIRLSTRYIWLRLLNRNQKRIYAEIARQVNMSRLTMPARSRRNRVRTLRTPLEQNQATVLRNSFLAEPPQNQMAQDQDEREILNSDLFNGSPQQFCFFGSTPSQ
ncbi:13411_t:CDS:1 [Acaulospora morrowiae]|uniref:13411_t:CDS:1 n=1 Tax=Acaulospora morrowiae TaxID=94023 RepID=A0A9N9HKV9_9GLOM|nr:13411_t:CDS:1 [Acaulospora morrowiae]